MDKPTHRPALVIPTYDNPRTVGEVVRRCLTLGLGCPVIVVDDGSGDETAGVLEELGGQPTAAAWLHVLHHPKNRGKAHALRTGFRWALDHGHTHALTLDADLQHDPEDAPALLALSREHPEALVLGERAEDLEHTPARSRIGRRVSNLAIRVECGQAVRDSQSGFRVYPLALVGEAPVGPGRFSYETEILVRAVWAGRGIVRTGIASRYLPATERVSHFRPVRDTLRSLPMHARLLGIAGWRKVTGRPVR